MVPAATILQVKMALLSKELFDVRMTYECPSCSRRLIKRGRWFYSIRHYSCSGCRQDVVITFDDKVKLFKKYMGRR
jgi:DNA-directed RNA polymerase subunit RPC12/RpoP